MTEEKPTLTPVEKLQKFLDEEGLTLEIVRSHTCGDDGRILCDPRVVVKKNEQ